MEPNSFKKSTILVTTLVLMGVSFVAGAQFGYDKGPAISEVSAVTNKENIVSATADFDPFWKTWSIIDQKFIENGNGTTTKHATDQERVWGAIEGMVASLGDPYTVFLPPVEKQKFDDDIAGNFGGVGMEVGMKDGKITVVSPLPNTPAKRAGIVTGDRILKINDTLTSTLSIDEAISKIRGKAGTPVTLIIERPGEKELKELTIVREIINIPIIDTKILPGGVFVISLHNFSAQSTNMFRSALREFVESKSSKLIVDLRGNPGGYMEAAIDISSWFLPSNKVVVREARSGNNEKTFRSHGYNVFNKNLKMAILVDQGSASASEIVAGALREHGVAVLVGDKTFGKGSVQELVPITKDTSLKVTVARWLTPNGHSISSNGLEPDYKVVMTKDDVLAGRDPQLQKAIEVLTK